MNPASSEDRTHVFPSTSEPNAHANASVSGEVAADGVISTSCITGGGLKKCIPITRAGRSLAIPSDPIGIDEVFEASTTSGRTTRPSSPKIAAFAAGSSVAASITRSTSASAASSGAPSIRPRIASPSAASSLPRSTACRTDATIRSRPASTSAAEPSTNVTVSPARPTTSAIPDPMRPAPTTPTCRTSRASTRGPSPSGRPSPVVPPAEVPVA